MRRNNAAKRFGIASLCLGVAFSAFSGIALLDNNVALAIGGKYSEPFSIVTADSQGATLTYDQDIYWRDIRDNTFTLCEPEGGIRLSSDQPYEEQITSVFTGDTTIKFTFPELFDWESKWYGGDFKIRVSDADDETNYFDVVYYANVKKESDTAKYLSGYSTCMTNIAINYKGMIRAISANRDKIDTTYSKDATIAAPSFLTHFQKSHTQPPGQSMTPGKLSFEWSEDGVLSIMTNRGTGTGADQCVVASFDGSYDKTAANNGIVWDSKDKTGSFGLPKLSFKNGYKISFLSDFTIAGVDDHATDVCIKEITTDGKTTSYTDYKNTETITILDRGDEFKTVEVGDEVTIPVAYYGENQEIIDVQVVRPSGKKDNVTPGKAYKVTTSGVHHITYCFQGDATNESLAAISFTAKDWTKIQTTDFVHTAASVTQNNNGLRISSDNAYKATFKSIFTGNTTLNFKFPETYTDAYYGDFTFRITDATDDNKYFDIKYYVANEKSNYTGVYVKYGDEVRQCHQDGTTWYNAIQENAATVAYAPSFLSYCGESGQYEGNRMGILSFEWTGDVLAVQANTSTNSDVTLKRTIAKFDGTNSFVDQESWGLPKMNFTNGYTITVLSSVDNATDVLFSAIENGNVTYNFNKTELVKDSNMQAFAGNFKALTTMQTVKGKVFLGWKNTTTNKLYPAYSIVRKVAGQSYEAVVLIFDTVGGASVRIDTKAGKSGIRFQTFLNVDEYKLLKGYIQSVGTLVAYTDTLTSVGKDFTIENYQGESTFAKVENTKGTYELIDKNGGTYTAYSMAVVDIKDYTKEYSARGYLVVEYADGSTQTIYTDYNDIDNSSSIANAANQLKKLDPDAYNEMSNAKKAIVDTYAAAYVMP